MRVYNISVLKYPNLNFFISWFVVEAPENYAVFIDDKSLLLQMIKI